MGVKFKGSSAGGSINVPDSLRFANVGERDSFFTSNPSRLKKDTYCTVADQLQRYNGTAWENTAVALKGDKGETGTSVQSVAFVGDDMVFTLSTGAQITLAGAKIALKGDKGAQIISGAFNDDDIVFQLNDASSVTLTGAAAQLKGEKGDNAPLFYLQYSASGDSGWSDTLNPAVHKYWRWSTDGGLTWSADFVLFSGGGAGLTPQQEIDLADNTAARHEHANQAILDATTGTFTLARQEKLDGVQDTWKGSFSNAIEINASIPTPANNWSALNRETGTVWSVVGGLWVDTGASSLGDMAAVTYDPQGVAADVFARVNHTGTQAIATIEGLQAELDLLPVLTLEIDYLEDRIDNPSTGLVKSITDLDTQINEAGVGVVARMDALEQGGATTTKLRTHSISGKYEDGEIVQRLRNYGAGSVMCIYRANSAIDGSGSPVTFVEGTGPGTWTELSPGGADFGDVKHGFQKVDHGGWWLMNGREVSTLPVKAQQASILLGFGSVLPNMSNRTVFGSSSEALLGGLSGSNTIARNNLPNEGLTFSGTSAKNNQGHTHKVDPPETNSGIQNQKHSHKIPALSGTAASAVAAPSGTQVPTTTGIWDEDVSGNLSGSNRQLPWTSTSNTIGTSTLSHGHTISTAESQTGSDSGDHWHKVNIPEFNSGAESQTHTHTYSGTTQSMSGGATQVDFMPAHLKLNYFIYLGF